MSENSIGLPASRGLVQKNTPKKFEVKEQFEVQSLLDVSTQPKSLLQTVLLGSGCFVVFLLADLSFCKKAGAAPTVSVACASTSTRRTPPPSPSRTLYEHHGPSPQPTYLTRNLPPDQFICARALGCGSRSMLRRRKSESYVVSTWNGDKLRHNCIEAVKAWPPRTDASAHEDASEFICGARQYYNDIQSFKNSSLLTEESDSQSASLDQKHQTSGDQTSGDNTSESFSRVKNVVKDSVSASTSAVTEAASDAAASVSKVVVDTLTNSLKAFPNTETKANITCEFGVKGYMKGTMHLECKKEDTMQDNLIISQTKEFNASALVKEATASKILQDMEIAKAVEKREQEKHKKEIEKLDREEERAKKKFDAEEKRAQELHKAHLSNLKKEGEG